MMRKGRFLVAIIPLLAAAPAAAQTDAPFPTRVDDTQLQAVAGRENLAQLATSENVAEVSRNSVGDNSRTGDVRIADNAFQNLSGLSILNLNSGNNVAINASMNVNISLSPAP